MGLSRAAMWPHSLVFFGSGQWRQPLLSFACGFADRPYGRVPRSCLDRLHIQEWYQCVRQSPSSASQGDDLRFRVVHRPTRTREFLFKPSVLCCFLRVASVAHLNDVNIVLRPVRWPLVTFVLGLHQQLGSVRTSRLRHSRRQSRWQCVNGSGVISSCFRGRGAVTV
jgi:hypothetical protein